MCRHALLNLAKCQGVLLSGLFFIGQTGIPAFYSSVSVFILCGGLLSKVVLIVLHVHDVYLLTPVIRELYTSQMYTDAYLLAA